MPIGGHGLRLWAVDQASVAVQAVQAFAPSLLRPQPAIAVCLLLIGAVVLGVRVVRADRQPSTLDGTASRRRC